MLEFDQGCCVLGCTKERLLIGQVIRKVKENPDINESRLLTSSLQYNLNVKNSQHVEVKKKFISDRWHHRFNNELNVSL
jgi:hypothetical protein